MKNIGLFCLLISWIGVALAGATPAPVRIMPLGDSLTEGYSVPTYLSGYRERLVALLASAGYNVDYVGTQLDTSNPALPYPNQDHEGHGGWRIDQIDSNIEGWLNVIDDPDVILLLIGTNDFYQNYNRATASDRLESLVAKIATLRPYAKILLSNLPLQTTYQNPGQASAQSAYNASVSGIVSNQVALGRQVSFVNMNGALVASDLSSDGVHPNQTGYNKMAATWLPAITGVISPEGTSNPPAILRIEPQVDLTHVSVTFTKPVADASVSLANFSLSGGVTISNAVLDAATKRTITLTTSQRILGLVYTLTVSGVRDRTAQQTLIAPGSTVSFYKDAVTNGSFESDFAGWTVTGNAFIESAVSPYTATDGVKLASFNGSSTSDVPVSGVLAQAFSTTPGTTYTLAFDMGVIGSVNAQQKLEVTVDGVGNLLTQIASKTKVTGSTAQWSAMSYTFVANSATATLTFRDVSTVSTNIDALLDNVRITAVPNSNAPLAVGDSATIHSGQKVLIEVLANDSGSIDPTTVQIVSPPSTGTAMVQPSGEILYTHSGTDTAPVSFSYRFSGANGLSPVAAVNIAISSALRIPNNTLNVPAAPPATAVQVVPAYPGVTFTNPLCFASPPGDPQRLFVCEFGGRIKVIPDVTAATATSSLVLDLPAVISTPPRTPAESFVPGSDGEAGLLGMTFHPNYATNGYFYVSYMIAKASDPGVWYQRLSRFTVPVAQIGQPAPVADPSSELILIEQRDRDFGHNGGNLHFGADGYLYWPIGDEGNQVNLQTNAQRIDMNFFSAMLRIDVDKKPGNLEPNAHANPAAAAGGFDAVNAIPRDEIPAGSGNFFARYSIPIDNPFVATSKGGTWNGVFNGSAISAANLPYVRSEFWAVGLRSPWRFSIDEPTGEMWVGDVGQDNYEELHTITKGGNYGWAFRDGAHPGPRTPTAGFTSTDPIYEYLHTTVAGGDPNFKGNSIIGGLVYRGTRFASLTGAYIFGDHISGHIWALTRPGGVTTVQRIAGQSGITTFGTDPSNGDVLVSDYFGGRIMRIVTTTPGTGFPATLSATKLFADLTDLSPAPGVLPYAPNLTFWSDYAVKRRWFTIPDANSKMTWSRDGSWTFPSGQIWVKHFDLETERGNPASPKKRIETRVLVKNDSGVYGVSYRWNEAGTDATLVDDGGEDVPVNITVNGAPYTQRWQIPSRSQCNSCHSPQAGHSLSFNTRQLNLDSLISGFSGNQIDLLRNEGYFSNTPESSSVLPRHYRADETAYSLEERARSYLAVNCSYCHAGATGTAPGSWDGRPELTLNQTGLINGTTNVAGPDFKLIAPADTTHSVVLQRMAATGGFTRMPPLGSSETDPVDIALVTDWINQLPPNSNTAPVAVADGYLATQNTALVVPAAGVLANDTDDQSDPLTAVLATNPSHGSLTLNPNGGFTYTPVANYAGADSFTYRANDGSLNSNVATVNITVNGIVSVALTNGSFESNFTGWTKTGNAFIESAVSPYTATDGVKLASFNGNSTSDSTPNGVISQSFATTAGTTYTLAFDIGVIGSVNAEQKLQVTVDGAGNLLTQIAAKTKVTGSTAQWSAMSYTFVADSATTTLTFRDISAVTAGIDVLLDNVRITYVGYLNTAPTISDVTNKSTNEDTATSAIPFIIDDLETAATSLIVTRASSNTTLVPLANVVLGGSGTNRTVTITPAANQSGTATITLTVSDGTLTASDTFVLTVNPVNDPPTISDVTDKSTNEDTATSAIAFTVGDIETAASSLTVSSDSSNTALVPLANVVLGGSGTNRTVTITPAANQSGTTTIILTVSDGTLTASDTFVLTVNPVNDPPLAIAQAVSLAEDGTVEITLTGSDIDGDSLTFLTGTASHGTVSLAGAVATYTPAAKYHGPDSFSFTASDGTATSAPALVSLTVTPVNDPPVAIAQAVSLAEDGSVEITLTGSDIDGDSLTFLTGIAAHGTVSLAGAVATYTPDANYHGTDSFNFTVDDGTVVSTAAVISITVTPVNDPPLANAQAVSVAEDGSVEITLTASDLDGDSLTFLAGPAGHGTVVLAGAVATYTPEANYNGPDSFSFTANDGTVDSAPAVVSLTVTPVNDPPVADTQAVSVAEDGSVEITLAGSDVDGDSLTFATGPAAHGTLTLAGTVATYTPEANYNGPDSFSFSANDGTVDSTAAVVTLTVAPVNHSPVANAQSVSLAEDGTVEITLTGSDLDGDSLTFLTGTAAHGTVDLAGAVATYTPAANYHGPDSFSFTANDGTVESDPAIVSLTVTPVNDAPVAIAQSVTLAEDGSVEITLNGSDIDGDSLTILTGTAAHGTVDLDGAVATYTPAADFYGTDSFSFTVNDGAVDSTAAVVTLTVTPVNDPPVAIAQTVTLAEDGSVEITLTGSDLDGDSLTFLAGNAAHGTVTLSGAVASYTPAADYHGADSFSFTANDGTEDSTPAVVSLTVTPVNDLPVADTQTVSVAEDGSAEITLTGSDLDGDSLTFLTGTAAHGTVTLTGAVASYTPAAGYHGADSFNFTVSDGNLESAAAAVSITVTPVNDPPLADAQSVTLAEDGSLEITLTASDLDGDSLTFLAGTAAHGTVTLTGAVASYTPAADYHGTDSFSFTANDGTVDSVPATVSITVTPVNDPPVADTQAASVAEDGSVEITLTGSDLDGDSLTFLAGTAAHGTVTLAGAIATYTPAADYHGTDSFSFTVNDGTVDSAPAVVSITVNEVFEDDFIDWLAEHGLVAGETDSDNDSIHDAVEYVIGGNPVTGMDINLLPTCSSFVARPGGNPEAPDCVRFTYRRTDRANNNPSAAIKVEWTTDLAGPWADADGTPNVVIEVTDDGFDAGVDRVDVYLPKSLAVDGKLFARLGVAITPP